MKVLKDLKLVDTKLWFVILGIILIVLLTKCPISDKVFLLFNTFLISIILVLQSIISTHKSNIIKNLERVNELLQRSLDDTQDLILLCNNQEELLKIKNSIKGMRNGNYKD